MLSGEVSDDMKQKVKDLLIKGITLVSITHILIIIVLSYY